MQLSERYELGELLGEGGFGKTYAATDRERGTRVVVKQLNLRELPDWKPFEHFEREAKVLASLDHPGVPRFVEAVHEGGAEQGEGLRLYLVSERILGDTLGMRIAKGHRWSASEAEALCRGLLEVLRYLHELLPPVIHRDIKPDNIVLRADGSPVLVDFGAVRDLALPGATGGATVLGTPGYMAPEQALGRADARSDLYGLGTTLAHVFTHRHPRELLDAAMQLDESALAGLPEQVRTLIVALTRTDPTARPASAAEGLAHLAGELPPAAPPAVAALARRPGFAGSRELAVPEGTHALAPAEGRTLSPAMRQALNAHPVKPERAVRYIVPWALGMVAMIPAMAFLAPVVGPVIVAPLALVGAGGPLAMVFRERARSRKIYAKGVETRGRVTGARASQQGSFVDFEFEVEGERYEGYAYTRDSFVIARLEPGAPVRVFYDADRPDHNFGLVDELV